MSPTRPPQKQRKRSPLTAARKASEDILERQESFDFGPPSPLVREARDGERRSVLEVLGRAFNDDPVATFLFSKDRTRVQKWARFSGIAIDSMGEAAQILTTDTVEGAAVWQRPSEAEIGGLSRFRNTMRFLALAGFGVGRAKRLGDMVSAHRPSEPHYYLAALGTDPHHQGRGIGSALIQPVLDRCDKERIPAYLESSKERNLPFYQRHGFEVVEALEIPNGPGIWTMVRRTR